MSRVGLGGQAAAIAVLAVSLCTQALTGQTFEELFEQGTQAMRAGQLAAAAEKFTQCIAAEPNFAQSYFNLALITLQQGHSDQAAGLLTKTLQLKPGLRGADLFLGIADYRLDKYQDSLAALQRAVSAEPLNADALMWLGMAELGTGNPSSAVFHLEQASKLKPNNADILYHLGQAYMQLSKETYERLYRADPKSWRVHQVLAESFEEADRLDDAVKECLEAIQLRPAEPGLHQMLGEIYWKQNNLEKAEDEFENELKIDPDNSTAIYKLASVSLQRSKPEVAAELLAKVLKDHPDSREAHYQLGRADAELSKTDAAIAEFSAAAKGKGPVSADTLRQSYYQLAQLYRRAQRIEESKIAMGEFARLKQQADLEQEQKLADKLKRSTEPQE